MKTFLQDKEVVTVTKDLSPRTEIRTSVSGAAVIASPDNIAGAKRVMISIPSQIMRGVDLREAAKAFNELADFLDTP